MDKIKTLFGVNLIFASFFLIYSLLKQSIYIYDSFIYWAVLLLFWKYGKRLSQNFLSMTLVFIAIFFHNLGVFGLFAYAPFGLPYDKALHFFSGIYLTYALYLFAGSRMSSKKAALFLAVIGALGIGAFGELNEFTGWLLFPPRTSFEGGLLDPGVGKFLMQKDYLAYVYVDTITDMASNLAGSILTAIIFGAKFLKPKPRR